MHSPLQSTAYCRDGRQQPLQPGAMAAELQGVSMPLAPLPQRALLSGCVCELLPAPEGPDPRQSMLLLSIHIRSR